MRLRAGAVVSLLVASLAAEAVADAGESCAWHNAATREHDAREFVPVLPTADVMAELEQVGAAFGATLYSGVYEGIHGDASYLIQVPANWNGILVMHAHGFRGAGAELVVDPSPLYPASLSQGYAWAASSYSANYYDVRAGVEDTNKLALLFESLTQQAHGSPQKYYITGLSMGGHVAGAAVEKETRWTAKNYVEYAAALPLCGVMGDVAEFDWINDYLLAAQHVVDPAASDWPMANYGARLPALLDGLFDVWSLDPTSFTPWQENAEDGQRFREIAMRLTGGQRPIFLEGFRTAVWQRALFGSGGGDGTIDGIVARNVLDNRRTLFRWRDGWLDREEWHFNATIRRVTAEPRANPIRKDGVRWIPRIAGDFDVPVLTLHTLGDLFVPFVHEQLYRQHAEAKGNGDWLVQRAIRAAGHCEFAADELVGAFFELAAWEQYGIKPQGDEVVDPAVIAEPDYGCTFTAEQRAGLPACP